MKGRGVFLWVIILLTVLSLTLLLRLTVNNNNEILENVLDENVVNNNLIYESNSFSPSLFPSIKKVIQNDDSFIKTNFLWPRPYRINLGKSFTSINTTIPVIVNNLEKYSKETQQLLKESIKNFIEQLIILSGDKVEQFEVSQLIFTTQAEIFTDCYLFLNCSHFEDLSNWNIIPNNTNESFFLKGSEIGEITITSNSPFGIQRGMQTLLQLIQNHSSGKFGELLITNLPFQIQDMPLFSHRGLLVDSARHHLSIDFLKEIIKWMGSIKLNVFHWHISDDNSFPLQVNSHPNITMRNDRTSNQTYTKEEVKELIVFARSFGIRIIPEIDIPGHCGGWTGIGGLVSRCPSFGCSRSSVTLSLDNRSMEILRDLLLELFDLFPDPFFHLGGDLWDIGCWMEDPLSADFFPEDLFCKFEEKLFEMVTKHTTKKIIRWQEQWSGTIDRCRHTQSEFYHIWRNTGESSSTSKGAIKDGKKVIMSAGWYINSLCFDWSSCWQVDPLQFLDINPVEGFNGLEGGEGCVWEFSQEMWKKRNPYRAISSIAARLWEYRWDLNGIPSLKIGDLVVGMCNHAAERGVVSLDACVMETPNFSIFSEVDFQVDKLEQGKRLCERLENLFG